MNRQCLVKWEVSADTREEAICELLDEFSFRETTRELLRIALETREVAQPTIVHEGIAMPHCRSILVDDFMIVLGRSEQGIPWPDDEVNLIILFISPVKATGPAEHLELIKHLVKVLRSGGAEKALAAKTPEEIAKILKFDYKKAASDE